MEVVILHSPTGKLDVHVADTLFGRVKGLAFRQELPKDGMLFLFNRPCKQGFWMFGMKFDIDIIFIDEKKQVVQVSQGKRMTLKPRTWKTYYPRSVSKYVLETRINSGITEGDKLEWNI